MNTKNVFLLVFFSLTSVFANAQQKGIYFKKGDRVCFIGNSITHNGEFHHNILQYFVTRYPHVQISFFNTGIKGDVVGGVLNRLEKDILIHKPTHAIIMIGMNDVQRELYGNAPTQNTDTLTKRKAAIELYAKNLETLISTLFKKGIKIILQKPSAYDQTATIKQSNNLGVNDALAQCGNYMQKLAKIYNLPIVDYGTVMTSISLAQQKKTPNFTLTVNDRVHPNSTGHFIMGYQFLKTFNLNPFVSKLVVDVKNLHRKAENKNCERSAAVFKNNTLTFTVKENALPFPIDDKQEPALSLVPFTTELNNEIVQIQNLPKGSYQLLIDSVLIDNFTSEDLHKGINLSNYKKTPQYKQALQVKKALEQLWKNEASLRAVAFVEYMYLTDFTDKDNMVAAKIYLDSLYNKRFKGQTYYTNAFENYLTYKPQITKLLQQADSLRANVYRIAQPAAHRFIFKKAVEPTVTSLIEASQSGAVPLLFDVQADYLVNDLDNVKEDKEFFVRKGLPHFFKKMATPNTQITVGFLGGSITKAEDQYRNQTLAFIQTLNPSVKLKGINAGVSGTGTELGACRVATQILQYNPDLVFVEFAVNGGSNQAMEGIVRQIKKHNPLIDICFVYTIAGEQYKQYAKGEVPTKIQGFEKVATHYNLPSIHMGLYPSILEAQQKLVWKSNTELTDKIVFSKDGTHPVRAGGDLYAQAIRRGFNAFKVTGSDTFTNLPAPLYKDNWEDGLMLSPSSFGSFSKGWEQINPLEYSNLKAFAPWFNRVSKTITTNASFTFTFKGTAFGFFDIGGPEVGQVLIEVDGECMELTRKAGNASNKINNDTAIKCLNNRFNANCNNRYRGQFELFEVKEGTHVVKISLSKEQANKMAILQGQNLEDIENNPDKYNQKVFYLGKILLKGIPVTD